MQQQHHLHQSWLWLLLLPLLSLISCSGADTDDAGSQHPAASTVPISFTALSKWDEAQAKSSSAPHTRLSEDATTNAVSFTKNDAIGVFAYLNNSETPNFMNNQKVTYDGTNWEYSPVKYWPNNEEDKLSFYAYYPYREIENNEIISVKESLDKLSLTYKCQAGDIDLMTAITAERFHSSDNGGRVSLAFEHQLARIRFRFRNDWTEETNRYHLGINYLHLSCNTNTQLSYDFKSKKPSYSLCESRTYNPEVINVDGYYSYSQNDYVDIVAPCYFVPGSIKGNIELGIDVMEKNATTGKWEKITAHSTPTYIMQAVLPEKANLSKGASLIYDISFKPSSGLTITMITEVDGWKEIDNNHKI